MRQVPKEGAEFLQQLLDDFQRFENPLDPTTTKGQQEIEKRLREYLKGSNMNFKYKIPASKEEVQAQVRQWMGRFAEAMKRIKSATSVTSELDGDETTYTLSAQKAIAKIVWSGEDSTLRTLVLEVNDLPTLDPKGVRTDLNIPVEDQKKFIAFNQHFFYSSFYGRTF